MKLACNFDGHPWYSDRDKLYTCFLYADVNDSNAVIKSIRGPHKPRHNYLDVEAILWLNSSVNFFPKGLHRIFPNLRALCFNNCKLKNISRKDFIGIENLESFSAIDNSLTSLPNDLFADMRKLTRISFRCNDIEYLSPKLLKPILGNKLKYVSFLRNKTINACFNSDNYSDNNNVASLEELIGKIVVLCKDPDELKKVQNKIVKVSNGFHRLWTSDHFADLTIIAGTEEFRVQKNVLAAQSKVFLEIFDNLSLLSELKLEGLSADSVRKFLHFVCNDELSENANYKELFKIAAKLKVSALKEICEEKLIKQLDGTNAIDMLSLAHIHSSDKIKSKAFMEIKKMFPGRVLSNDLMNNTKQLKELIEAKRSYESMLGKFSKFDV